MNKQCQEPQANPDRCGCVREIAEHNAQAYAEAIAAFAAKDAEIASIAAMATMLENMEWAEHAAKGDAAYRIEACITVLLNEIAAKDARIAELESENSHLRHGMTGDYDLDAWLEWCAQKDATHSEDGREVPEVVAWMWRDINGDMQFNYMHPGGAPLMTVAQHSRIVAAKDAEIARLNDAYRERWEKARDLQNEMDAVIAERDALRAQPARQVGDDWPKLDKPAKVGGGRFNVGVSARLVVEAAQRQYEYDVTPEKEAERIAKAAGFLGSLQGGRQVGGDEPAFWLVQCKDSGLVEQAEPHEKASNPQYWTDAFPVYRAALAPAAVVMPDAETVIRETLGFDFAPHEMQTVNADDLLRLVEAARLNRNPIPVELLSRVEDLLACPQHHTRPEYIAAAAELRALLGKEG